LSKDGSKFTLLFLFRSLSLSDSIILAFHRFSQFILNAFVQSLLGCYCYYYYYYYYYHCLLNQPDPCQKLQILFKSLQNRGLCCVGCFMSQEAGQPVPCQRLQILYKSFTKQIILEPRAPHGSRDRSATSFPNASNPLQNGAFWSLGCLMAQEVHPPDPFQMLQILYKSFTKRSILEPRAPHGSRARARARARSPNPSPSLSPGPSQSPSPSPSPTPYIHINIAFTQMPPKA